MSATETPKRGRESQDGSRQVVTSFIKPDAGRREKADNRCQLCHGANEPGLTPVNPMSDHKKDNSHFKRAGRPAADMPQDTS